jgi:ferritin
MFDFLNELLSKSPQAPEKDGAEHLACLQSILTKKYALLLAYISYGDQLRAFGRDGVYEHFQEHIKEERDTIYQLNKKITALGGDAVVSVDPVPSVPLNQPRAVFEALLAMEQASVALWSELFRNTEDDVALNAMAQNGALADQQHADDMRRYLRSEC